jgi:N-acyl-phosphatidylethanolamine-hydrolysing phospholipase D
VSGERPAHHAPGGGFRDPWDDGVQVHRGLRDVLRWVWQRRGSSLAPDPAPGEVPRARPEPAHPAAPPGEVRATWIGHAAFLLQVGGLNLLTDPMLSERASPLPWGGARRFGPPALMPDELPELHAVLQSHDHFDHLDAASVKALRRRFGPDLPWVTPLGYRGWLERRGVRAVRELDWWESTSLEGPHGPVRITAAPARHWTRRAWAVDRRLWASYGIAAPDGTSIYFGGDTARCPAHHEIGRRLGPFDLVMLPIGAYEPRWFMKGAHMSPEEAVQAWRELGGRGVFVGMHWGAFRLSDEDPLEPPRRTAEAWRAAGLPAGDLHLPGIGGTVVVRAAPER